jgi:hypothetical protein
MSFGFCENCKIISPKAPASRRSHLTRRRWLKRATQASLAILGALYSPLKDGCGTLRDRIASRSTTMSPAAAKLVFKFGTPVLKDSQPSELFAGDPQPVKKDRES